MSRAKLEDNEWRNTRLQEQRIEAAIPCQTLLRNRVLIPSTNEIIQLYNPTTKTINLKHCTVAARSTDIDPDVSHAAIVLLDAIRLESKFNQLTNTRVKWEHFDWNAPLTPLHMQSLQHRVFLTAFCAQMNQKNDLIYLMSKTSLQRCMTRKFGGACLAAFKKSPDTCNTIKSLVLICLLGNYKHSNPSSRPCAAVRAVLYKRLLDDKDNPEHHNWFMRLTVECPYLIEFCIRDYLIYHMKEDPALSHHIHSLLNVSNFELIASKTFDMLRKRLSMHILLGTTTTELCVDTMHALKSFHTALLAVSYRLPKSRANIFAIMVSLRADVPTSTPNIVNLSKDEVVYEKDDTEIDHESEPDEDELAFAAAQEQLATKLMFEKAGIDNTVLEKEVEVEDAVTKKEAKNKYTLLKVAALLLGEDKFKRFDEVVRKIAPSRRDCLFQLISLFPLYGVKMRSALRIGFLLEELRVGSLNKDALPKLMREVKNEDSLAYDMLQICIDLIKLHTRVQLLSTLPVHITQGQIYAHQNSMTLLSGTKHALYDSFDFVFCSVCGSIYSMLREFKSSFKKT